MEGNLSRRYDFVTRRPLQPDQSLITDEEASQGLISVDDHTHLSVDQRHRRGIVAALAQERENQNRIVRGETDQSQSREISLGDSTSDYDAPPDEAA